MLEKTQEKIVYLFGAGATHAEMINLQKHLSENFLEKNGLLISHVSQRVIKKFRSFRTYLKDIEMVSSPKGSLNIELLISLIEHNNIKDADKKTRILKNLVRKDISFRLTKSRLNRFYLHKALLDAYSGAFRTPLETLYIKKSEMMALSLGIQSYPKKDFQDHSHWPKYVLIRLTG